MMKIAVVAVCCATLLVACGGPSENGRPPQADHSETPMTAQQAPSTMTEADVPHELVGAWTLVALDGRPVPEIGKTPVLEIFDDGSAAGLSGVNRFRSQIEASDGSLSFGPVAGTKMAGPPAAMELENTFLARLGAVSTYAVEGTTLRLWAGDNEALTFEQATPSVDTP